MKLKIKHISLLMMILSLGLLSSCLKKGLTDYAVFDTNEITLVNVEHRFNGTQTMNGQPIVAYQKLGLAQQIDQANSTINVQITVPAANGQFTAAEKAKVVQSKLWFYMNISTAASISPTGGTPTLGDPTDATKQLKYVVTAANGASRVWTINITSFTNN
ncbi:hypothetical protein G7074_24145 [Pedobacter sp. HDW13]|uniref:DUF5018-related domain-containing protein n=1 Tax=unclassified Pedobacter TaxID=2628915 RepID=UPI000F5B3EFF|nr:MULTISPECIES: hypothetical protein [unclassified Pedobacter]QIL42086.1 hypothetical protein G7074_24145 [Pedobacter sp. HDW13]